MMQVPKKMTCNEFIRNNRGINGGDNLPQDFLTSLYDNISKNEIKISSEGGGSAEASPILWAELNQQARAPRGKMLEISAHGECRARQYLKVMGKLFSKTCSCKWADLIL